MEARSSACVACHLGKVRCDKQSPKCGRCEKRGQACVPYFRGRGRPATRKPERTPSSIGNGSGGGVLPAANGSGARLGKRPRSDRGSAAEFTAEELDFRAGPQALAPAAAPTTRRTRHSRGEDSNPGAVFAVDPLKRMEDVWAVYLDTWAEFAANGMDPRLLSTRIAYMRMTAKQQGSQRLLQMLAEFAATLGLELQELLAPKPYKPPARPARAVGADDVHRYALEYLGALDRSPAPILKLTIQGEPSIEINPQAESLFGLSSQVATKMMRMGDDIMHRIIHESDLADWARCKATGVCRTNSELYECQHVLKFLDADGHHFLGVYRARTYVPAEPRPDGLSLVSVVSILPLPHSRYTREAHVEPTITASPVPSSSSSSSSASASSSSSSSSRAAASRAVPVARAAPASAAYTFDDLSLAMVAPELHGQPVHPGLVYEPALLEKDPALLFADNPFLSPPGSSGPASIRVASMSSEVETGFPSPPLAPSVPASAAPAVAALPPAAAVPPVTVEAEAAPVAVAEVIMSELDPLPFSASPASTASGPFSAINPSQEAGADIFELLLSS